MPEEKRSSLIPELYSHFLKNPSVCTDTRRIQKGDLFFALKGDQFNGNRFALQALRDGASLAIVDEAVNIEGVPQTMSDRLVLVPDALTTLQELAGFHRLQLKIPVIAITGSNGKTTTKELVHAVLSRKYKTYTTEGNLNNHIGIPLTLLKIKMDAEMAIVEMGANHLHEIDGYCQYTRPTHGLITNIGKAHLEGFGGLEGVKKGKGELYDWLRSSGGTAFVRWDDEVLRSLSKGITEIVSYGSQGAALNGQSGNNIHSLEVKIVSGMTPFSIHTHLTGEYNLPNVLAAVCIGNYFKVEATAIKNGIEQYKPSNSRSQLIRKGSNTIILDAYNANPSSMKLALENFASFPADRKILLLGAMAELGGESLEEHRMILEQIAKNKWQDVVLVGGDFLKIPHPYRSFSSAADAASWIASNSFDHTVFLVKGSRSTQMEKAAEPLLR